jgi:hypothetical protein
VADLLRLRLDLVQGEWLTRGAWREILHPRVKAGPGGGEFTGKPAGQKGQPYTPERVPRRSDITKMAHAIQETANQVYARHGNTQEPWATVHGHLIKAAKRTWERRSTPAYEHLYGAHRANGGLDPDLGAAISAHIEDLNHARGGYREGSKGGGGMIGGVIFPIGQ